MSSDYPFARVLVNKPGDPERFLSSEDPIGANHLHGLKFVCKKEEAAIYTAYRAEAISVTLLIARICENARPDPVTYSEWIEAPK